MNGTSSVLVLVILGGGDVYVHASIIGHTAATRNNDPKRKTPTIKRLPKSIPIQNSRF